MKWYVATALVLGRLWGDEVRAQNIYDPGPLGVEVLVTSRATDQVVGVYDARHFDLETEVPFSLAPRVIRGVSESNQSLPRPFFGGGTVTELCSVIAAGHGIYRAPTTLAERKLHCQWVGYLPPQPQTLLSRVLPKKKPAKKGK